MGNTKKYHQILKDKINNFKKLIYSVKETKIGKEKESVKGKDKKINKLNTNKKEKYPGFNWSNKKINI